MKFSVFKNLVYYLNNKNKKTIEFPIKEDKKIYYEFFMFSTCTL